MPSKPSRDLQTFPNPNPERDYEISFEAPEFTCLCPMTGQPDFATIRIRYVPDSLCVELKSLKLYLWSFRDEGAFHEAVTNRIANDLIALLDPRFIEVEGDFYVRGGIKTVVKVTHSKGRRHDAGATPRSRARRMPRGRSRANR
jgi:7-cyano-7-deazaguanine reductase